MKFGKLFDNPALKTRITSSNVKIQEMAIGYFLAPFLNHPVLFVFVANQRQKSRVRYFCPSARPVCECLPGTSEYPASLGGL